uniref:Uncharacterized protein n=1 Tax=Lactuca sativa TaxID=4236 RepID=A0A9R1VXD4_LACSA|nr:hypothetical protein LSAT_V11C400220770 [Lactuca sativa]
MKTFIEIKWMCSSCVTCENNDIVALWVGSRLATPNRYNTFNTDDQMQSILYELQIYYIQVTRRSHFWISACKCRRKTSWDV